MFDLTRKCAVLLLSLAIALAPVGFTMAMNLHQDMGMDMTAMSMESIHTDMHDHAMSGDNEQHDHQKNCDEPCNNCDSFAVALIPSIAQGEPALVDSFRPSNIRFTKTQLDREIEPPITL